MIRRNKYDSSICEFEVTKNRFGSSGTTYFTMTENGFDFTAVQGDNVKDKTEKKEELVYEYETDDATPKMVFNY